jgi:aromatic-amino-acid transaminase
VFEALVPSPPDPLLGVLKAFLADLRPDKLDLGVGVYRDQNGVTPVFRAVKAAERRLAETQATKCYIGAEGDAGFTAAARRLLLGEALDKALGGRFAGFQTCGGVGALRAGAETVRMAGPRVVHLGDPSWAAYPGVLDAARVDWRTYPYFEPRAQAVRFDALMEAVGKAQGGDVFLIQASCHNPTGADLLADQWTELAAAFVETGAVPFLDVAYQGFGWGLDKDAAGVREVLARVPEALVAYSCSKNLGLYRERTAALFLLAQTPEAAQTALSNARAAAISAWAMPPDHGAAVARMVMEDAELSADWRAELAEARARVGALRARLADAAAAAGLDLEAIRTQTGMFSTLDLDLTQVRRLRDEFGVYMTDAARINVAGLTEATMAPFVRALTSVSAAATRSGKR